MSDYPIPSEVIEAAAKAIYESPAYGRGHFPRKCGWTENGPGHLEFDRDQYRVMAEAAIRAADEKRGLKEAFIVCHDPCYPDPFSPTPNTLENAVRTAAEHSFNAVTGEPEGYRMLELLGELVDPDDCWFDHHGYCQAHNLQEKPCPHERARDLLREHGRLPKEGS